MKRLLAMILTVFFSIQNNVGIQFSGDTSFVVDSWYKIPEATAPDYRQLYSSGIQLTSADNCTPSTRVAQNAVQVDSENTIGVSAYWFAESEDELYISDITDEVEYTWSEAGEIIAPLNCTVVTPSTSGGGHSMRLDTVSGDYTFVFENMERWFCCRYRKDNAENAQWSHTLDVSGTTIKAGQLIGFAQKGTTVKVYNTKTGNIVSIKSFYNR